MVTMPELINDVEMQLTKALRVSRLKNKVLGTGYITGLKALVRVLNIPKPTVLTGKGCSQTLCETIAQFGYQKVLIVTDRVLHQIGVLDPILASFDQQEMAYQLFTDVEPDPTFSVVEHGLSVYRQYDCDCVLAVGGGSSIDSAKVIALAATNECEPRDLVGLLKGKQACAPFFVVPTTAGTGSEATIGAVISDTETHKKELVIDTKIVPMMAALDPELMKGLPSAITAATGLDALTHLIEAYLSTMATAESDAYARAGIQMVFENLPKVCKRGNLLKARERMALASYYGGLVINLAGLGYVHAFAHQIGALYRIPHGESNAKVLPHVLAFNKVACVTRLAELASLLDLDEGCDSELQSAQCFIDAVSALIEEVGIEASVPDLKPQDFGGIIKNAFKEANSTYAVPKYMSYEDAEGVLLALSR